MKLVLVGTLLVIGSLFPKDWMAELTAAERAVYDRQLRVWGVETQQRYVISLRMDTMGIEDDVMTA